MKKIVCFSVVCMLLLAAASLSFAANTRTYRGFIKYIGYDLKENRVRVDVFKEREGDSEGRGQLYFENEAAKKLAQLIHLAFIHKIRVEVWVHINDSRGRANVIYTVNFSNFPPRTKRKFKKIK